MIGGSFRYFMYVLVLASEEPCDSNHALHKLASLVRLRRAGRNQAKIGILADQVPWRLGLLLVGQEYQNCSKQRPA